MQQGKSKAWFCSLSGGTKQGISSQKPSLILTEKTKQKKQTDLKLAKVLVDILDIFTTEHGIVIVICIHIPDVEEHVREGLAQII